MEEASVFEAAAAYDSASGEGAPGVLRLIFDTDTLAAGLLAEDLRLLGSVEAKSEGVLAELSAALSEALPDLSLSAIREALAGQRVLAGQELRRYLPEELWDGTALRIADTAVSARALAKALSPLREKSDALAQEALLLVSEAGADEEALRILFIGEAAPLYFTEYAVRELISFDPTMPDARFAAFPEGPEPIAEGREILASALGFPHDIALLISDAEGAEEELPLIGKGEQAPGRADAVYRAPILFTEQDALRLRVDERQCSYPLPYPLPAEGDMVQVAFFVTEGAPCLFLRRVRIPTRIYEIKIEI